ncbi:MAG TPA: DNA gyrase inhibitor YacG [Roseomonas sp.]
MPADPKPACPVCGRPPQPDTRPFCSARCRSVDLGRWLGGTYSIPGPPETEDDEGTK